MSINSVAGSATYQVPITPKAVTDDERTESAAVKNKEAETGKESAVAVKKTQVDTQA
jgi:hypothetical protein